jgi:hypothetical protein
LIGPNWRDLDLSLGKGFQFPKGIRFEIRADATNSFNHPNFSQPTDSTGTGVSYNLPAGTMAAQQITAANGARFLQLGGRLTF